MEKLYTVRKKQDWELTVAQIMNTSSLAVNADFFNKFELYMIYFRLPS